MPPPVAEQKKICALAGGFCMFETCRRWLLTADSVEGTVILGEIAHIVAESEEGPRGKSVLTKEERNRESNLMLVCNNHHQLIDSKPASYTVERLHAMKEAHVARVKGLGEPVHVEPPPSARDELYSTLLPFMRLPSRVYGFECNAPDELAVQAKLPNTTAKNLRSFILRDGHLWTFSPVTDSASPLGPLITSQDVKEQRFQDWEQDPVRSLWLVDLVNRALGEHAERRGLAYDKFHRRHYFPPDSGRERSVTYKPLNQAKATRNVAWQPKRKNTKELRPYWLHRAARFRVMRFGRQQWFLCLRPEMRVTKDGYSDVDSKQIGRRVTRMFAKMFNYQMLGEVHFWRDYIGDSKPLLVLPFGSDSQSIEVNMNFASTGVSWPGLPAGEAKSFTNAVYAADPLSTVDLDELEENETTETDWEAEEDDDEEA